MIQFNQYFLLFSSFIEPFFYQMSFGVLRQTLSIQPAIDRIPGNFGIFGQIRDVRVKSSVKLPEVYQSLINRVTILIRHSFILFSRSVV